MPYMIIQWTDMYHHLSYLDMLLKYILTICQLQPLPCESTTCNCSNHNKNICSFLPNK